MASTVPDTLAIGMRDLEIADPDLFAFLNHEEQRQQNVLGLIASCSIVPPSVLACLASASVNVTAEGYPGGRYHAGCDGVDDIEALAIERALSLFGARYVNVQPHSASTANYAVLTALLNPGDTILGMELNSGGHLTHGSKAALSGNYYRAVGYGLNARGEIDLDQVRDLARKHRPKLLITGATAYSRHIDFAAFREIADDVGAIMLADISHTAGLVVAGLHGSPINHAHITTTCTHKQLQGPRGGLILSGRDADEVLPHGNRTVRQAMQRAVFPLNQGAPAMNVIAAKARTLAIAESPEFRTTMERVVATAQVLAKRFMRRGHQVVSGGTDNHIVLLDLSARMSGVIAEQALSECRIVVNKNHVPNDPRPAKVTSGLRLGTNGIASRGMTDQDAELCADLVSDVLARVVVHDDRRYELPDATRVQVREVVDKLTTHYPLPDYSTAPGA